MTINLQFLIILILICCSGAIVFQANTHLAFAFLAVSVFVSSIIRCRRLFFNLHYVTAFIALLAAIALTVVINQDAEKVLSYVNLLFRVVVPFLIPLVIPFNKFVSVYLRVIYFLAVSSLLIFSGLLVDNSWYANFPKVAGLTGLEYYNLGLFVIADNGLPTRNNSIFWEPGAFQAFLTLGLLFELYIFKCQRPGNILLLCVTSLTTVSTTGYVILSMLFVTTLLRFRTSKIRTSYFLMAIPLVSISAVFIAPQFVQIILEKFADDNMSSLIRFVSTVVDLQVFYESIFLGVGLTDYSQEVAEIAFREFSLMLGGSMNSLTYHLAVFGLPLVLPLMWMYWKFCWLLSSDLLQRIVIGSVLVLTFSTENFLFSLLWLTLGFYGMTYSKTQSALLTKY